MKRELCLNSINCSNRFCLNLVHALLVTQLPQLVVFCFYVIGLNGTKRTLFNYPVVSIVYISLKNVKLLKKIWVGSIGIGSFLLPPNISHNERERERETVEGLLDFSHNNNFFYIRYLYIKFKAQR